MAHRVQPTPSLFTLAVKRFWPRSRLARDIALILAIKLTALVVIKLLWFSDPPATPTLEVDQALFGLADESKHRR
jgi:hypothetical protein